MYVSCLRLLAKWKAGESPRRARLLYAARNVSMPELCLSYAPWCRGPRPPLAASGQRSAHPLPSRSRLRPRSSSSSSSYSWPTDLLSRGVVSPHGYPCPTRPRRRRRVFVVRRRRDASLTLRRDSRPTGSNDARARQRFCSLARIWKLTLVRKDESWSKGSVGFASFNRCTFSQVNCFTIEIKRFDCSNRIRWSEI